MLIYFERGIIDYDNVKRTNRLVVGSLDVESVVVDPAGFRDEAPLVNQIALGIVDGVIESA